MRAHPPPIAEKIAAKIEAVGAVLLDLAPMERLLVLAYAGAASLDLIGEDYFSVKYEHGNETMARTGLAHTGIIEITHTSPAPASFEDF